MTTVPVPVKSSAPSPASTQDAWQSSRTERSYGAFHRAFTLPEAVAAGPNKIGIKAAA